MDQNENDVALQNESDIVQQNENDVIQQNARREYVVETLNVKLARAYVPFQKAEKIYSPGDSLRFGTVFPELNDKFVIN